MGHSGVRVGVLDGPCGVVTEWGRDCKDMAGSLWGWGRQSP